MFNIYEAKTNVSEGNIEVNTLATTRYSKNWVHLCLHFSVYRCCCHRCRSSNGQHTHFPVSRLHWQESEELADSKTRDKYTQKAIPIDDNDDKRLQDDTRKQQHQLSAMPSTCTEHIQITKTTENMFYFANALHFTIPPFEMYGSVHF